MYPVIRVNGDARERGRRYGAQARERVHRSIAAYREVFEHYATWDWSKVLEEARRFHEPIRDFGPDYHEELVGIAEGAEVGVDEIVAINVRTEVMFAAKARTAGASLPSVGECSSFAGVGLGSGTIVGQNWDWLPHAFDTTVVLEVDPATGPRFVTVVEAGLLAKTGLNSAGLGVCTNALVSADDVGAPGVPYHVLLRALLDATTPTAALATLQRGTRSSSANYLLAHDSGLALDIEASPGDFSRLYLLDPDERGWLLHTNHFLSKAFAGPDVGLWVMPDSPFRLQRVRAAAAALGSSGRAEGLSDVLSDHAGHPFGVCCHPEPEVPEVEQGATVASVVMNLTDRCVRLASGNPCEVGYDVLDYGDFLASPHQAADRDGFDASGASVR